MPRCPLPAVLLLLAVGSLSAVEPSARVPLPGESAGTGRRLDAADRLAADKQYAAAADEYVRIIDEAGDDLVAVDAHLAVPARRLCHLRLAALPPEVLRPYRTRVDPQAKKWLEQAAADHDVYPLQRIVDETFCSRHTDAALDLLGDLAFERGQFHEAARWWRMLALPASEAVTRARQPLPPPWTGGGNVPPNLNLLYPDPQIDVARTRAKQVLALLFRGENEAAKSELEAFRALHPRAEGHLAGRRGNYADTLQAIALRPIPGDLTEDAWPTFGGTPSRAAVLPAEPSDPNRLNSLVDHGPAWTFRLGEKRQPAAERPFIRPVAPVGSSAAEQARHLAFHPIIVGRHVLVADARSVTAFDSTTGDKLTWDLGGEGERPIHKGNGSILDTALPAPADLRYTLTAADGRIYARLGVQGILPGKQGAEADSFLVCLKLANHGHKLTEVWVREADPGGKGARAMFEGAPVVRDGLLHVAATRFEGGTQMITEVRCYSADSDAAPRWKQDVATTRDVPTTPRYRHQLLTLGGRHVVFASHTGTIVALDARTGRRAWAYRYPSAVVMTSAGNPVLRDLAPPVYAAGRLYVAPADYDRLLCLDPETGQLIWEREGIEVVHLLGVGSGRLIFTTPKGIRAVGAEDGDDNTAWQMPDPIGSEGLPSYGRGFLAGQYVFWPTASGIKVLNQDDGQVPFDPVKPLIPGPLEVSGRLNPGNLAYVGGLLAVADQSGLRIYLPRGRALREPPEEPAIIPAQALNDLARRATALAAAGKPGDAVAIWQRILADDGLRGGILHDSRGLPQSAAIAAADRIDELLRAHGRTLYAPMEDKARALIASGKSDAVLLERVVKEYPNAKAANAALRQLGKVHEDAGRWGAAQYAYLRLLFQASTHDESDGAAGGCSRAEAQEKKRAPTPAARPDLAASLVRAWEKEERLLPLAEESPGTDVLLTRGTTLVCRDAATGTERWTQPLAGPPSWAGRDGQIVVVAGPTAAQGVALSDGTRLWELPAPDAAAFTDPRLSAFHFTGTQFYCLQGECRLLRIDARIGHVRLQHWAPAARLGADVPNSRFSPQYLATGYWVLLQFPGRCRALDANSGRIQHEFPGEAIPLAQPPLPLGKDRFAIVNGRRIVTALDLAAGKVVWEYKLSAPSRLSGEPPMLVGNAGALFVVVPRNAGYALQRLDPATGRAIWAEEVALDLDRLDSSCFACDDVGVYYTSRNVVTALDRYGKVLWEQALPGPEGAWRLRRAGEVLVAWPAEARRTKFHSRWLTASLELEATFPPEDRPGRGIPVLLLAPASADEKRQGDRVMQRLNFAPPIPRAQGRLVSGEELTAVPTALSECAAADGPVVLVTGNGLVVGWDGKTWALGRHK
jgi:outer membrane protein assembly factor BamB